MNTVCLTSFKKLVGKGCPGWGTNITLFSILGIQFNGQNCFFLFY